MPVMTPMALTNENYYSDQANAEYMSVSQFKEFAGSIMHRGCEMTAYGKMTGKIRPAMTKPLLVGSYIDAFYEGTLDGFKDKNRELICTKTSIKAFEKSGSISDLQLLADFKQAEAIIEKTTGDPLFCEYTSGQKQTIMTAFFLDTFWKIKMDFYFPGDKIVDLKVMRSMDPIWSDRMHLKSDFIRYWGYDIQGAVYQEVVYINTGKRLPFFIACATKEDPTNIEIIQIDQKYLDDAMEFIRQNIGHVLDIKTGKVQPAACGDCYWCRMAKKLTAPVRMSDLVPEAAGEADGNDDNMSAPFEDENTGDAIPSGFGQAPNLEPFHLFGNTL